MNPVIAPISKNNNVEQQLDSREFPTIGKNATQFSNSPSRIHIEPQKIHIDKDLDNRRSSIICGIKEINLVYKDNRDDANEIKCEKQNRQLFSKNEKTNTINTSGNKKNIVNDFVKNSQPRKTSREHDVDVIIYQLVIKENKPSNELTRNKSSYIKNVNNRDTNNILGKISDYKGDIQNAIFKWNNIDGSFGPQNQNVSGTNNLRNVSGNKQIFINGHVTTEASFDQKEFFRAQGKEQKQYPAIPLDNQTEFNENKNIDYDNSDAGTYNIGNIKNPITNAICSEIYKPSGFVSLSGTKSHINGEANILCTITNIKKLRFCVVLELCIGYISSDKNAGNCNSRTKQIRLKVPKTYVRDKKQTLALEIKLGHYDRRVALRSPNRPENIAASTIGRDAYLSIVIGVPSDVRYIVLNIPEDPQYEIDIESATLQVIKNTEREIMFDIRSDNLLQNKKIINKEDPISLNNYEAPKFDIKNDEAFSNEKIISKEEPILASKNEDLKFDTKSNIVFSNEKILNKKDFILQKNNESLKFDVKDNGVFLNANTDNKENFLSSNNYENTKFDIKIKKNEVFSNEKIDNKEDFVLSNNNENTKFDAENNMTFSNEKMADKENFVSKHNYKDLKLDISDSKPLLNENIANKENSTLQNNCEDQKFGTRGHEVFQNKKIINKGDFLSLNNYESPKLWDGNNNAFSDENIAKDFISLKNDESLKLDSKDNEALSNEKKIDEENFASQNNYENSKFGIKNDMSFSNEEVVKKEDLIPSNNFKNTKINVENYNGSFNEKVINKENLLSPNNCESPKFDINVKTDEAFSNEKIDNKGNFVSQNTYENIKFRVNRKEEFPNEKIINKENFIPCNNYEGSKLRSNNNETLLVNKGNSISLDNYGNTKFDIRISGTFSNEKMINNEYSIPSNSDNGNKKLVIKCGKVFLNEEINNKEHSVASNNAEGAENRDHESEPSVGILGRVAGFFGQIMGMCRRKK